MPKKKIFFITLGCLLIIGAAFFFGNRYFNWLGRVSPKNAVLLSAARTLGEIKKSDVSFFALAAELFAGQWKHDVTVGVNKIDFDFFEAGPKIVSALEMFTFKNTARGSGGSGALDGTLTLQFAVTPVLELYFAAEKNLFLFNVPQAFDFFIAADPRRVSEEWDYSLLGAYFGETGGLIMQDAFYEYYRRILKVETRDEAREAPPNLSGLASELGDGAEISYLGKRSGSALSENKSGDAYSVTLPAALLNSFFKLLNPLKETDPFPEDAIGNAVNGFIKIAGDIYFTGGAEIIVFIKSGKIFGITFEFEIEAGSAKWKCSGEASFAGEGASLDDVKLILSISDGARSYKIEAQIISRAGNADLSYNETRAAIWDENGEALFEIETYLRWDKAARHGDNFSFALGAGRYGGEVLSLETAGSVHADSNNQNIDVNLKKFIVDLQLQGGSFGTSLNLKYLLRASGERADFDLDKIVPLTQINEDDVLEMYERLLSDKRIGPLLEILN